MASRNDRVWNILLNPSSADLLNYRKQHNFGYTNNRSPLKKLHLCGIFVDLDNKCQRNYLGNLPKIRLNFFEKYISVVVQINTSKVDLKLCSLKTKKY